MDKLRLKETSISGIIQESIHKIENSGDVRISFIPDIKNDTVWLDHKKILSALLNIEKNALEAMPHGGTLTITLFDNENEIIITVNDTGTGISPHNMEMLFTPFFSTKPAGEGTGLGLCETYGIIKAHKGDISIESNNDPEKKPTGTTIKFRLPRSLIPQGNKANVILH